jgi:hypothetical protein
VLTVVTYALLEQVALSVVILAVNGINADQSARVADAGVQVVPA